jgi:hypothetical protein
MERIRLRRPLTACILFACVMASSVTAAAQGADSTAAAGMQADSTGAAGQMADSAAVEPAKAAGPSPRAAVLRSAVLPGWGQWTNGQKIKSVLVMGGGLGLIGNAYVQNRLALRAGSADEREFYRNNRSQSIWWFAGLYLLNLADAYVDAELWNFDAGPNLSEGIDPAVRARVAVCFRW